MATTATASEQEGVAAPVRRTAPEAAAVAVPLALLLAGAWSRRWTSDDGFINLRIVEQLWAGNGPVWNATERVEAGTSPLWLAVLAGVGGVARAVALEWVAVVLGIACTVGGLAAGALAARRLHGPDGSPVVPLGALVVAALPPFWDFASSGLETGLSFLWLGTGAWALACVATRERGSARRTALTAGLVGLGPLVRPDLALVAAALLVALVLLGRPPRWRRTLTIVAAAGLLPVGYQLFRMAFFAALVPNTAFAKEGGASRWGAGWAYAGDFAGTWHLWWPAVAVAVPAGLAVRRWVRAGDRRTLLVVAGITAGAALHALYVIRVGGDFMHARLLLPATFAALLPWAVLPLRRTTAAAVLLVVPWALLAATAWEAPGQPGGTTGPAEGVVDERAYYVAIAAGPNPVTADDFGDVPYAVGGRLAAASVAPGVGALTLQTTRPDDRSAWAPARDPAAPFTVTVDNVGIFGFLAGPDVQVIDLRGLADPVTSRFRLEGPRGRPGHEKAASPTWVVGRYGAPGATAPGVAIDPVGRAAAAAVVACGPLAEVLDGISEPLTLRRAADNVVLSVRSYGLRLSSDPATARAELCDG